LGINTNTCTPQDGAEALADEVLKKAKKGIFTHRSLLCHWTKGVEEKGIFLDIGNQGNRHSPCPEEQRRHL
jgi:hypothetical protein